MLQPGLELHRKGYDLDIHCETAYPQKNILEFYQEIKDVSTSLWYRTVDSRESI